MGGRKLFRAARAERRRTVREVTEAHGDWPYLNGEPLRELDTAADGWLRLFGVFFVLLAIVVALFIAFVLALSWWSPPAHARDLDGHYATQNPELHAWFDGLQNGNGGLCCSFVDGSQVDDVDWDTNGPKDKDGNATYRVRIQGAWVNVPPEAVVKVPNRFGPAVVWPYKDVDGVLQIRCFLPGAGA